MLRCSLETIGSDDILSKDNLGMYKHVEPSLVIRVTLTGTYIIYIKHTVYLFLCR